MKTSRLLVLATCAGLLLLFGSGSASGATAMKSSNTCTKARPAVDSVVEPLMASGADAPPDKIVAAEVGLYLDGKICYFGYGTTQFGTGQKPTPSTLFKISSVTKTFTATMLALHEVRNSGFDVNGTVNTALIPCADGTCLNLANGMQELTYFDLATFTGGLPDQPTNLGRIGRDNYTQANYIAFLNGLSAPPGGLPAKSIYSNVSYGLLGELVMALDGYGDFNDADAYRTSFDQWIGANITSQLGMTCTTADINTLPSSCDVQNELAPGYGYQNGHYVVVSTGMFPWQPDGPGGKMYSNAQDMVRYLAAYLGANKIDGLSVPKDLTQAMALARAPTAVTTIEPANRQAYSWFVTDVATPLQSLVEKNGGGSGYRSCVTMKPSQRTGVVLLYTAGKKSLPCSLSKKILQGASAQTGSGDSGGSGGFAPLGLGMLIFTGIIFYLWRRRPRRRRPNIA